jgi:hypothetical protein
MDFLGELLVQIVIQFVVEVIGDLLIDTAFRGLARALQTALGRYVTGAVLGLGIGLAWGHHLSGSATWPKLLWVSLGLAAAALVLAPSRPAGVAAGSLWRQALTPPWRWPASRLVGFAVLNLAIAAGIALTFRSGLPVG